MENEYKIDIEFDMDAIKKLFWNVVQDNHSGDKSDCPIVLTDKDIESIKKIAKSSMKFTNQRPSRTVIKRGKLVTKKEHEQRSEN